MSGPAVFLDRDGVLNELALNPATGKMESPLTPGDLRVIDGVLPGLQELQAVGYPLILVSNQPNYALGKASLATLDAIHERLMAELECAGVRLTRVCYCLHHPRGVTPGYSGHCLCRKPSPWFLQQARDDFGLSLAESWMIGDQPADILCAKAAGVRSIGIGPETGCGKDEPDYQVPNLFVAAEIILAEGARAHLATVGKMMSAQRNV